MSVLIEAVSVVIKTDSIRSKFPGGWSSFRPIIFSQYSVCADSSLASVSFLAAKDAYSYTKFLEEIGFVYLQDFAIADQTQGLKDNCGWCYITNFKIDNNAATTVTGCKLEGCRETKLYVPPGWEFKGSLSQSCRYQDEGKNRKVLLYGRKRILNELLTDLKEEHYV